MDIAPTVAETQSRTRRMGTAVRLDRNMTRRLRARRLLGACICSISAYTLAVERFELYLGISECRCMPTSRLSVKMEILACVGLQ